MRVDEYSACDATALAALLSKREVSADEVYEAARVAIDAVDAQLHAMADGPWERPLEFAQHGPFGGVPFAIKDVGAHPRGVPVRFGTRLSGDGVTFETESFLLTRFRDAGFAAAGITTAPEFGYNFSTEALAYGASTRNPWDLTRSVGGSSGGAAALVAAGGTPVAHAGDGGGSIRVPAAFNGLVGLKPSRGRTSDGPECQERLAGLGVEFGLVRTMRDCAALLDAIAGAMPGDRVIIKEPERPWSQELGVSPGRLRIAINTETWSDTPVHPDVVAAVETVANELEALGHHVERATPSFAWDRFVVAMTTIMSGYLVESVASTSEASGLQPGPDTLEHTIAALYERGQKVTLLDMASAMEAVNDASRIIGQFLTEWDLLVTPTANIAPPPLGYHDANDSSYDAEGWIRRLFAEGSFTPLFNWTGNPAISLPLGSTPDGLPVGVQFVAPMCEEARLIRVGSQMEEAMPWSGRRPQVYAGVAPSDRAAV